MPLHAHLHRSVGLVVRSHAEQIDKQRAPVRYNARYAARTRLDC